MSYSVSAWAAPISHTVWGVALDGSVREDADIAEITALMRHRLNRTGWPKR